MRLAKSQAHQPFPGFFGPGFFLSNHRCKSLFQSVCPDLNRAVSLFRQMHSASALFERRLEDGYKVLADFNGTVLAGVQSKHGVHFVTWDWAYGHTGVCHGHYFMENYAGAKQDFAIRSGLIQKERLFTPEQMTEIYRCCADSVDGDFFELTGEQEKMIRSVQQQIEECVPDLDERIRQQEEALEQVAQQQTM